MTSFCCQTAQPLALHYKQQHRCEQTPTWRPKWGEMLMDKGLIMDSPVSKPIDPTKGIWDHFFFNDFESQAMHLRLTVNHSKIIRVVVLDKIHHLGKEDSNSSRVEIVVIAHLPNQLPLVPLTCQDPGIPGEDGVFLLGMTLQCLINLLGRAVWNSNTQTSLVSSLLVNITFG